MYDIRLYIIISKNGRFFCKIFAILPMKIFPHILFGLLHFFPQLSCGHPQHAAAEGGQLHQAIGGCHSDRVVAADLVSQSLDIGIGGLPLLGIHHLDVVKLEFFSGVSLLLVAVEHHHQPAFGEAHVAA